MRSNLAANPYSVLPYIREIAAEGDLFHRIKVLSEQYESSKCAESRGSEAYGASTNLSSRLAWYDSCFGEKLVDSVKQFENSRQNSLKPNVSHTVMRNRIENKASAMSNKSESA